MLSSTLRQVTRRSTRLLPAHQRVLRHASRPMFSRCALQHTHRRMMSTPPAQVTHSELSTERYHALSDATMDSLLQSLEELLDALGNPEYEVEYHSGVLTLVLGNHGTYVVNKQPPNKQIWLSSPLSGPKRYDYSESDDDWVYSRDGVSLGELLNEELSNFLEEKIDLGLSGVSSRAD